jgi:hypothetical protein
LDRQNLQANLQSLKTHPTVRVAFVLDKAGALMAWAGKAAGFSPVGQFPSPKAGEDPVNLYLTTLGTYYLGVLFLDSNDVDLVRDIVEEETSRLMLSLGVLE